MTALAGRGIAKPFLSVDSGAIICFVKMTERFLRLSEFPVESVSHFRYRRVIYGGVV